MWALALLMEMGPHKDREKLWPGWEMTAFSAKNKDSFRSVRLWSHVIVSCDWWSGSYGSLIRGKFNPKINRGLWKCRDWNVRLLWGTDCFFFSGASSRRAVYGDLDWITGSLQRWPQNRMSDYYSSRTVCVNLFNVTRKWCGTGPKVYRPYPRRLES